MKKRYICVIAIVVFGLVFIAFYILKSEKVAAPALEKTTTGKSSEVSHLIAQNEFLKVTNPKIRETIVSPLTVKGTARGTWYFEATFPVKILDLKGVIIGQGIAHAEGDWMTENFVPFKAVISFTAKTGEQGEVVFQKDNPSGLPENDDELRVSVVFGK